MKINDMYIPDHIVDNVYESLVTVCGFKKEKGTKDYAIVLIIDHMKFIDAIGGRIVWNKKDEKRKNEKLRK